MSPANPCAQSCTDLVRRVHVRSNHEKGSYDSSNTLGWGWKAAIGLSLGGAILAFSKEQASSLPLVKAADIGLSTSPPSASKHVLKTETNDTSEVNVSVTTADVAPASFDIQVRTVKSIE